MAWECVASKVLYTSGDELHLPQRLTTTAAYS